jgi:hypothetical protein
VPPAGAAVHTVVVCGPVSLPMISVGSSVWNQKTCWHRPISRCQACASLSFSSPQGLLLHQYGTDGALLIPPRTNIKGQGQFIAAPTSADTGGTVSQACASGDTHALLQWQRWEPISGPTCDCNAPVSRSVWRPLRSTLARPLIPSMRHLRARRQGKCEPPWRISTTTAAVAHKACR